MGCKVPAHDRRGRKLSYKDWIRLRDLMDALRRHGLSWTDISLRAGKKNRGWAAETYHHRSNARDDDLSVLEEILDEVQSEVWKIERSIQEEESAAVAPEGAEDTVAKVVSTPATETQEGEAMIAPAAKPKKTGLNTHLTPDEAKFVLQVIDRLKAMGKTSTEIAGLLGYSVASAPSFIWHLRKRGGFVRRRHYNMARQVWSRIEAGDLLEATAPPPAEPPTVAAGKPATGTSTAWAWMDRVQEKLLEAAVIVDEAAAQVPEAFRGPYNEKRARIEKLIEEFQR